MAQSTSTFDGEEIRKQLADKGYCVIPDVITRDECDNLIGQYKTWLSTFEDGTFPKQRRSLVHSYRIGHFGATWSARLRVKPVFASVWDTEKLLTSFDGVAIGRPPEETGGKFDFGENWFHCDQKASRIGLHGYQGALYLEETIVTDHCFRVLANSHRYYEEFYAHFAGARRNSMKNKFFKLTKGQIEWFRKHKCEEVRLPVPKGGMVLWDSRTIHDNVPPMLGRPNSDRWRWVVFICMTPAKWATKDDLEKKAHAYKGLKMTPHWPSTGVSYFEFREPRHGGKYMYSVETLPEVAKSQVALRLAGIEKYDFDDGESNGPEWTPLWDKGFSRESI